MAEAYAWYVFQAELFGRKKRIVGKAYTTKQAIRKKMPYCTFEGNLVRIWDRPRWEKTDQSWLENLVKRLDHAQTTTTIRTATGTRQGI